MEHTKIEPAVEGGTILSNDQLSTSMTAMIAAGDFKEAEKIYWIIRRSPQFMDNGFEVDKMWVKAFKDTGQMGKAPDQFADAAVKAQPITVTVKKDD